MLWEPLGIGTYLRQPLLIFPKPASQHSISSVDLGLQHFAALRSQKKFYAFFAANFQEKSRKDCTAYSSLIRCHPISFNV
jgi:hypothetical protein